MDAFSTEYLLSDHTTNIYSERNRSERLAQLLSILESAFESVGISPKEFAVVDVPLNQHESLYTVQIKSSCKVAGTVFYLTHGFGGTSLFFYEFAAKLRQHGQVVLIDLRGMGFSSKYCPPLQSPSEINRYFVDPIETVRRYFKHQKITWVTHSFGSYVAMLYTSFYEQYVQRQIVFSPIGITPKQMDNNSRIRNPKDLLNCLINHFGWRFQLTYKTLLRYFACCCKRATLRNSFISSGCSQTKANFLSDIVMQLYREPFSAERLFFQLFEPRVLPKYDLLGHYLKSPIHTPTVLVYGETDWVDRQGAKLLTQKYPEIFTLKEIKGCTHQIFFQNREGLQDELINLVLGK